MEKRRSPHYLLTHHPTLFMAHLRWLEHHFSYTATTHHNLNESSSMWAISPGYDYSNLSIYKTNCSKCRFIYLKSNCAVYRIIPDSSQLFIFILSKLIKLLSLWYQPSHHVVMMQGLWCVIKLYDGIQNWKKDIMNVDVCMCMWEGIPIQGHERPCMLYAVYLHFLNNFFFIIYWIYHK